MARKDLLTRLADAGEDAISRLAGTPGTERMVGVANTMRARVDELQKRMRGLDELERRVAELERRLDEAEAAGASKRAPARRTTTRKPKAGEAAKRAATKAEATEADSAATRTARSGSTAEPTGPATQGASQAGNPEEV